MLTNATTGDLIYHYSNENQGRNPPMKITDVFRTSKDIMPISTPIDTAYYDAYESAAFIFKGEYVSGLGVSNFWLQLIVKEVLKDLKPKDLR